MFLIIWLSTIIISYFYYRYCFANMEKNDKENCPIGVVMFVMLIPFMNLVLGLIIHKTFVKDSTVKTSKVIDTIFNIKS
jgi:hypothetical protein